MAKKSAELALILSLVDEVTKTAGNVKSELLEIGKASSGAQGVLDGLAGIGKTVIIGGIAAATAAVTALAGATAIGVKEAIAVESAFAGVIKTTDGLADSSGKLTDAGREMKGAFRDLAREVPTSLTDLMGIGEMGGQLGVAREGLVEFTRTIAMMGETTNLVGEEAATTFAQIGNIMGTIEYDRMGSSIVELGNNFATTERDIANFAQRIAGAGKIAGLSTADIFGIGAAFASVGIEAEAGGTAVQKVLMSMNAAVIDGTDDLALFAKVAGMSASDFSATWKTDAAGAFAAFVQGLGAAGDDAMGMLEGLELKDQRLVRAFLSLANAGDLVTDAIQSSNEAWDENTALANEAAQRYATTESQLAIIKNILKDVALSLGEAFLPAIKDVLEAVTPFVSEFAERLPALLEEHVLPVIETVTSAISMFIGEIKDGASPVDALKSVLAEFLPPDLAEQISNIVDTVVTFSSAVATFVTEHAEGLKAALIAIGAIVGAATIVSGVMGIVAALNPLTLIIIAIIAVAGLLAAAWAENWGGIQEKTAAVVGWIQEAVGAFLALIQEWWAAHGDNIIATVKRLWETVTGAFRAAVDWISNLIQTTVGFWTGWWSEYGDSAEFIFHTAWNSITTIFNSAIEIIKSIYNAFKSAFEGDWYYFGVYLRDAWDTLWFTIRRVFENAWDIIQASLSIVAGTITGIWNGLKDRLTESWQKLWNSIKSTYETKKEELLTLIRELPSRIIAFFTDTDWGGVGRNIIEGIAKGITSAVGVIKDAARKAAQNALDAAKGFLGIKSPSRAFREVGLDSGAGFAGGLLATVPEVVEAVGDISGAMLREARKASRPPSFAAPAGWSASLALPLSPLTGAAPAARGYSGAGDSRVLGDIRDRLDALLARFSAPVSVTYNDQRTGESAPEVGRVAADLEWQLRMGVA